MNDDEYSSIIDKLSDCNPEFNIYFFTYQSSIVTSKAIKSSVDFACYGPYIEYMKKYMRTMYIEWDKLNEYEKEQIINRRCKRLRFETIYTQYTDLQKITQNTSYKTEERYIYSNADKKLIRLCRVVKLKKAEETTHENTKFDKVKRDKLLKKPYNPSNIVSDFDNVGRKSI